MGSSKKPSIGIIGTGRLGTSLARLLHRAGYSVMVSNSRDPVNLALIIKVLLPGVQAGAVTDTIRQSDTIILALPYRKFYDGTFSNFADKIVIDAMNYWSPTEGEFTELTQSGRTTSEFIVDRLPDARVVKTLNHIAYSELEEHSMPANSEDRRRAVAIASDDDSAKRQIANVISDIGFDPVDIGPLANGSYFQPDTPLFNARLDSKDMMKRLREAES